MHAIDAVQDARGIPTGCSPACLAGFSHRVLDNGRRNIKLYSSELIQAPELAIRLLLLIFEELYILYQVHEPSSGFLCHPLELPPSFY